MNLIQTIEELDPGHFGRREVILENLRKKAKELGFFPLPLTQNDIECFWIRLEPNSSNKDLKIHFTKDDFSFIDIFKDVARYEI